MTRFVIEHVVASDAAMLASVVDIPPAAAVAARRCGVPMPIEIERFAALNRGDGPQNLRVTDAVPEADRTGQVVRTC